MNRLTANTVDWFTDRFDRCWCDFDGKEYDKDTVDVIAELLDEIYRIEPDDVGRRELWIPVDRGDITVYSFYKELQEEDAPEEDDEKIIEELIKRLESVDMTAAIPAEQIYEKLGIDPKELADFDDIDFE